MKRQNLEEHSRLREADWKQIFNFGDEIRLRCFRQMPTKILVLLATIALSSHATSIRASLVVSQTVFSDVETTRTNVTLGGIIGGLSNSLLLVGYSGAISGVNAPTVSYGATNLTNSVTASEASDTASGWYYLTNPTGTEDVTIDFGSTSGNFGAVAFLITGVDTANPILSFDTFSGTNTTTMDISLDLGVSSVDTIAFGAMAADGNRDDRGNIDLDPTNWTTGVVRMGTVDSMGDDVAPINYTSGRHFSDSIGYTELTGASGPFVMNWETENSNGPGSSRAGVGIAVRAVPEPSTYILMGLGMSALGWHIRRRRKGLTRTEAPLLPAEP